MWRQHAWVCCWQAPAPHPQQAPGLKFHARSDSMRACACRERSVSARMLHFSARRRCFQYGESRLAARRRCMNYIVAVTGETVRMAGQDGQSGDERGNTSPELGNTSPELSQFKDYEARGVQPWLLWRLLQLGFTTPTAVQRDVLDVLYPGDQDEKQAHPPDVVIHAQTGTGKTLAYLIPLMNEVDLSRSAVQALIVVPTQELGMQVYRVARAVAKGYNALSRQSLECDDVHATRESELESISSEDNNSSGEEEEEDEDASDVSEHRSLPKKDYLVLPLLDQANLRRQKLQLRQAAPRIVIATPGRLMKIVQSGRLQLHTISFLVVDEFDACLQDAQTTRELQDILAALPKSGDGSLDEGTSSTIGAGSRRKMNSAAGQNPELVISQSLQDAAAPDAYARTRVRLGAQARREQRQTVLASATVPQHRHFLKQCVNERWTRSDVVHVYHSEDAKVPENLRHLFVECERKKKVSALRAIILAAQPSACIVFVHTSRDVRGLAQALNAAFDAQPTNARDAHGNILCAVALSNDMEVAERKQNLTAFRDGHAAVLLSTDVGTRGLDISRVSHVVNLDLPPDTDTYIHRGGRAGRAGRSGTVVSIADSNEMFVLRKMENSIGQGFEFERASRVVLESWSRDEYLSEAEV
ncbi:DEAD-box ATP-dependent RNA helicase 58, chloroplastic [Porphyridium purpureum]|uniref:DEAD-box ATP-dependent RNA helicase 58, chloroplastic n=1 Tax=Porphyridium purpureum TaxID=35688 RepID=A0A5J4YJV6_PORPP|nr:DEAD-box ATP-dependent RNA helicase 58, chloroplastic [Porphyridium purpureum]|eukprot:POR4374..scf291_13